MGSLKLACPLCCSETFTCYDSLKYHLLSISENLICPACDKRFDQILELALHIGRQCTDLKPKAISKLLTLINSEEEISQTQTGKAKSDDTLSSKDENSDVKIVTTLVQQETNENKTETDKETKETDVYFCTSCELNFTSLEEHLEKFHEGHEVLVEDLEDESAESSTNFVKSCDEYEEEEKVVLISPEELINNTVEEEECVDMAGRLYTRKVVKIEKFWDENDIQVIKANTKTTLNENSDFIEKVKVVTSSNTGEVSEIYRCMQCHEHFYTETKPTKHSCKLNIEKYWKCKACKAYFVNPHFLANHMKLHKKKPNTDLSPPFICEICNTELTSYKSLRLHKRMHEPIKAKGIEPPVNYGAAGEEIVSEENYREQFVCEICNKPYDKEYEEAHKEFHNKETDFTCEVCNRKFFSQENLTMHMRAHSDSKKFQCTYCKKGFITKEKLDAHIQVKCEKRQYECQYCGRRFARPHEKVKHERIHTGEKPHVCEICGKAFRVSYCLTLHMRTHSGSRPYKCDHCGKRFKAHSVYNHHLLTHSEDRKYKCSYCPKTFKTGVQLAGHKNSHTKPFTCTECNRPFASLYAVRAHMDTHQRQNNLKYRCYLCGASYARAFALRDHVKEQHGDDQVQIDNEAVVLDSVNYTSMRIVDSTPILEVGDESMLIDIGNETVENIELPNVQIESDLHDSSDT